jgi:Zn-dependent peptidase ImmA (M78 family)
LTSRQKFQRAFAAEFLCPSELIRQRYADKLDKSSVSSAIDDVSSEYDVSDQVVLHHMENGEVLPKGFLGSPLQLA